MGVGGKAAAGDVPSWLLADVGRLCNAQEVVLSCGTAVLGRWEAGPGPGPRFVVAGYEFGVGADAFELRVLDDRPRQLQRSEVEALRALLAELKRRLESAVPAADQAAIRRVEEHVSLVVDYVAEGFILLAPTGRSSISTPSSSAPSAGAAPSSSAVPVGRVSADPGTLFETEVRAAMAGTVPRACSRSSSRPRALVPVACLPCKQGLAVLSIDITERKRPSSAASIEGSCARRRRWRRSARSPAASRTTSTTSSARSSATSSWRARTARRSTRRSASSQQIGAAGAARARPGAADPGLQPPAAARAARRSAAAAGGRGERSACCARRCRRGRGSTTGLGRRAADGCSPTARSIHQVLMNLCTNAWHALRRRAGADRGRAGRRGWRRPDPPASACWARHGMPC